MDMQKELLEILACPRCRGQLEALWASKDAGDPGTLDVLEGLCCRACAVVYPIREGIPVMLIEEGIPLNAWRGPTRTGSKDVLPE